MCEDETYHICRLCLQTCDYVIDIFDPKGTNGLLMWEIIKEFLQLEVNKDDGLPVTICPRCASKMTEFKYFKAMCINSRIEFLKMMANKGLVGRDTDIMHSLPKLAMFKESMSDSLCSEILEIPEDRDPLDFIIEEKPLLICQTELSERTDHLVHDESEKPDDMPEQRMPPANAIPDESPTDHGGESPQMTVSFPCSVEGCQRTFGSMKSMQNHRRAHLEGRNVKDTIEDTTTSQFVCDFAGCTKAFGTHKGLCIHKKRVHVADGESRNNENVEESPACQYLWGCPFCKRTFGSRGGLRNHVQFMHAVRVGGDLQSKSSKSSKNWKIEEKSAETTMECTSVRNYVPPDKEVSLKDCKVDLHDILTSLSPKGKEAGSVSGTRPQDARAEEKGAGTRKLFGTPKKPAKKSSTERNLQTSRLPVGMKSICDYCFSPFPSRLLCNVHMHSTHHKREVHWCVRCRKSFNTSSSYKRHGLTHARDLNYWCCRCRLFFSSSEALEEHIRSAHNAEKPAVCSVCRGGYYSDITLAGHHCVLFGNLFTCPKCGKTFRVKSNCSRHIETCCADGKK